MFRHLKCHPQGAHCALLKLHTDFFGLSKIRLLKYKMINFNKMLIYSVIKGLRSGCTINILLKFIVLYFNNLILLRPKKSVCNFSKAQSAP